MKFVLGGLVLVLVVALVQSETCTTNGDCMSTTCATGSTVVCEHPDSADGIQPGGGLCTCATDSCATRADCLMPNHPELACTDDRRHCYDNVCICSRWPSGGQNL